MDSKANGKRVRPDRAADEGAGSGASVALARVVEPSGVPARSGSAISGLEVAFLAFLQSKVASPGVPVERRIFLTIAESAEFSGLPVAFLRKLIAAGTLKALRTGAGWRIPRLELEGSLGALTDAPKDEITEHQLRDMELNRLRRRGIPSRTGEDD